MSAAGQRIIAGAMEAVAMVQAMKPLDDRLALHGWAPGQYMAHCSDCKAHFAGDKRAFQCADCAYSRSRSIS